MLKRLLSFLLLLTSLGAFAQNGLVTGLLTDTLNNPVANATVTLQNSKDSALVSFTLSGATGAFTFKNVPTGSYRVLVTHLAFHSTSRRFVLTPEKPSATLDPIRLYDKAQMLPEFELAEEAPPVTLKGDTLEFNGSSFKTAPNAVVEDLLKKMPGVEIGTDGTIKINGQTVSKVLVDGKEFFGSDPNIATKNLPADAIDKVQVFDKKSDNEQLTGMDDGSTDMTVNLKLKADKKKGAFGSVMGGYGYQDKYKGKLNINRFDNGRQMALLANANNVNEQPFSFMDVMSFMGGMKQFTSGGGGNVTINISPDDNGTSAIGSLMSGGQKKGINDNWSSGFHFGDDLGKKKKTEFTGSYFYNRQHPVVNSFSSKQIFLPDSSYNSTTLSHSEGYTDNHRFDFLVRYKIDSVSLFKLSPSFNLQDGRSAASDLVQTLSQDLHLSNAGTRGTRTGSDGYTLSNEALYQKSFAKKGRSLSLQLNTNYRNGKSFNINDNSTSFYSGDSLQFSLDQRQKTDQSAMQHDETARAAWTEPLSKRSMIEVAVKSGFSVNSNARSIFDYNAATDAYDQFHDALSNNFRTDFMFTNASTRVKYSGKKASFTAGSSVQQSQLTGHTPGYDNLFTHDYLHILPYAQFAYNFTKFRDIRVTYSSDVRTPSIGNLQPVTDITNPLYIRTGNTDLHPEQTHNVMIDFKTLNPFEGRHFFTFLELTRTDDAITSSDITDSYGVTTSHPVNGAPSYRASFFSGMGLRIPKLKSDIDFDPEVSWNRSVSYINTLENMTNSITYRPALHWSFSYKEVFDATASARYALTDASYSLRTASDNRFTTQTYSIDFTWQLPKKFTLESTFSYIINENSAKQNENLNVTSRTEFPLWKASLAKQFTKSERAELKFQVYDILNQNKGVTQNTTSTYVEYLTYNTLGRYYMLSFTWKLSKTGGDHDGPGGGHGMRVLIGD